METPHQLAETLGNVGSKMQYTGASMSVVLSFINANAAALGVVIGLVGLLMNYHFKRKAYKLLDERTSIHRRGDIPEALKEFNESD